MTFAKMAKATIRLSSFLQFIICQAKKLHFEGAQAFQTVSLIKDQVKPRIWALTPQKKKKKMGIGCRDSGVESTGGELPNANI